MPPSHEELPGVAALADRPVDGRAVALVMAAVATILALGCVLGVEHLLASACVEPESARLLRRHASPVPSAPGPSRHVALVLIDGMRVDEARELPALRALAPESARGTIALPTPTLSRPFYHLLLTGVPPDASGVRSNRFAGRARFDSVADRVRDAGGSVSIVAEGLHWMRRMHGRPGDGGSDAPESIAGALDEHLRAWREAPAPALLIAHFTSTDGTAHRSGIRSAAHRRALEDADRTIARVAERAPVLFVLSDHGHRDAGGHGGPEPEVARAPLLVRAPGLEPAVLERSLRATELAPTLAAWLGVGSPRSALSAPAPELVTARFDRREPARLASLARQARSAERLSRLDRQRWLVPLVLLISLLSLGPIKRAYGFDRAMPLALFTWPLLVALGHLALDRPFSYSAIDGTHAHIARVAGLGAVAALLALGLARLASRRGDARARWRRSAAGVGWSAAVSALLSVAWVGLALGPWPLSPLESYLPLLALGAAAPALAVMALVLLATRLRESTIEAP